MRAIASPSMRIFRAVILAGAALLIGLFGSTAVRHEPSHHSAEPHARWSQLGRASWYGHSFQGQPTASGEVFDLNRMTCAHRSLPLGALVRVTNLHNHRSVVVEVNDRGPQVPGRIVDLSYGAARILGVHGMARVRLDLVDPSPTPQEVASLTWVKPGRR